MPYTPRQHRGRWATGPQSIPAPPSCHLCTKHLVTAPSCQGGPTSFSRKHRCFPEPETTCSQTVVSLRCPQRATCFLAVSLASAARGPRFTGPSQKSICRGPRPREQPEGEGRGPGKSTLGTRQGSRSSRPPHRPCCPGRKPPVAVNPAWEFLSVSTSHLPTAHIRELQMNVGFL